jgi:1-acyl-sn-glycerol-3-phosphate acyltransferase
VPRPPLSAILRTSRVAAIDFPLFLGRLLTHRNGELPGTTTAEGLAAVGKTYTRTLSRLGVTVDIRERERVPREGGIVFMWNQETHLDQLLLAVAIPRPFFCLYNNEVARFPLYGEHLKRAGHVHVDRTDETQWRAAIARAAKRVHEGECVLVSPEGTRSRDGKLLPMKRGAFLLAAESRRPIVCATVIGGHALLPRDSFVVRKGVIRVVLSAPISTEGYDAKEDALTPLMDRVVQEFETTKRDLG